MPSKKSGRIIDKLKLGNPLAVFHGWTSELARDRRTTHVQEIELDSLQWERYFAQTQPNPLHTFEHDINENSVFVFDRVRD